MMRLLVIDNDQVFSHAMESFLSDYYDVHKDAPARALDAIRRHHPHVILLGDDPRAVEIVQKVRQTDSLKEAVVILFFQRMGAEQHKFVYQVGADLGIEKPPKLEPLLWQIKWLTQRMERFKRFHSNFLEWNSARLNVKTHELTYENRTYVITPQQTDILRLLFSHPEETLSREGIKHFAWRGVDISDRSIDAQVSKLKSAVGSFSKYIISVYGKGYRLTAKADSEAVS